jgi:predicted GNAT superfamily acetyltransferase
VERGKIAIPPKDKTILSGDGNIWIVLEENPPLSQEAKRTNTLVIASAPLPEIQEKEGMRMERILSPIKNEKTSRKIHPLPIIQHDQIFVRKATMGDLEQIYKVACSVGKNRKDSYHGFLIDDYASDPEYYKALFRQAISLLDHFYVAEKGKEVLGFLMAYTKRQWLAKNPNWLDEIVWHPLFDRKKTENFILVDKTAIRADLTSQGIGSRLYMRLVRDARSRGVLDIFGETVVDPIPNFASLAFRRKQHYTLAGVHYEEYGGRIVTDLVYHKSV